MGWPHLFGDQKPLSTPPLDFFPVVESQVVWLGWIVSALPETFRGFPAEFTAVVGRCIGSPPYIYT